MKPCPVWIDADAAFVPGGEESLRALIDAHPQADALIASNLPFSHALNAGVQVWRSRPQAIAFLEAVAAMALPPALARLEGEYTLLDYGDYLIRTPGNSTWVADTIVPKPNDLAELTVPNPKDHAELQAILDTNPNNHAPHDLQGAYRTVDALCQSHNQERNWEQPCMEGMLSLNAFRSLRENAIISTGLQTIVSVAAPTPPFKCADSQQALLQWNGSGITTPAVHWAACEADARQRGLEALRQLHGLS